MRQADLIRKYTIHVLRGVNKEIYTKFYDDDLKDDSMLYKIDKYVEYFIEEMYAPMIWNFNCINVGCGILNDRDMDFLLSIRTENRIRVFFPENTIAVAVGNDYETGIVHIVIDALKFRAITSEITKVIIPLV